MLCYIKKVLVLLNIIKILQFDSFSPKNKDIWLAELPRLIQKSGISLRCGFVAA
jgi:hypothetical protein